MPTLPRGLSAFLLALALAVPAFGAPAPFPRPPGKPRALLPADVAGAWEGVWGPARVTYDFRPDGTYREAYGGTLYAGFWGVEGGVLLVSETWAGGDCPLLHYEVAGMAPGRLSGTVRSLGEKGAGSAFALVRRRR